MEEAVNLDGGDERKVPDMLRQARPHDIAPMHRVRLSVRENRLVHSVVTEDDYLHVIDTVGRGWVIDERGEVLAFAAANAVTGNIWALFVHPDHEGKGYGRRLHDEMLQWLWSRGLERVWLTTSPGTRAQRFYERAGWRRAGHTETGEARYEMTRHSARTGVV